MLCGAEDINYVFYVLMSQTVTDVTGNRFLALLLVAASPYLRGRGFQPVVRAVHNKSLAITNLNIQDIGDILNFS